MKHMNAILGTLQSMTMCAMALGLSFFYTAASAQAADVNGIWLTESQTAKIEVSDCGNKKCGTLVWMSEPTHADGSPKLDTQNPDESLRTKPLIGTKIIWDMAEDGPNAWSGGKIYKADDGDVYKSKMSLNADDTLGVSGCVLFICKEQTWTRSSL